MAVPVNRKNDPGSSGMLMQAGILAAAGIVVRIIGLLYRSPLTGIIGDEGNGYYNSAYNCYAIILLISAYSIPSAISRLIAAKLAVREYRNAQRVFHAALIYVTVVSGAFSVAVYFGAGFLTIGNAVGVLRVFSPTILLFGFLGVLRGYFQARRTMIPTSISQIIEQIVNAAGSLIAAWLFIRGAGEGADSTTVAVRGATGSALGTGAGVLAGLIFMIFVYMFTRKMFIARIKADNDHEPDKWGSVFKLLILTVTPFILSTFIYNFSTMLDQTIYQRILFGLRHVREKDIMSAYGIFSTKAVVITNIPIALANAMSSAMMPNIAAGFARRQKQEVMGIVDRALKVTILIAVPCAVGLAVLARPVMLLLFPQRSSLDEASLLLTGMAVTVIFYSISTVTNAVLQGIGKVNLPVVNAAISLTVQAVILTLLLLFTEMDNGALVVAAIVYSFMMCVLNNISMRRHAEITFAYVWNTKIPLISAAVMAAVSAGVYHGLFRLISMFMEREYLANLIALMPAILIAVLIYFMVMIKLGGVTRAELLRMPKGRYIVRLMEKLRIMPAKQSG